MSGTAITVDTQSIDAIREQDFLKGDWLLELDADYGEFLNTPGAFRKINWEEMYAPMLALWNVAFRERYIAEVESMWKKGDVDKGYYIIFNKVIGPKTGLTYTVKDNDQNFKPYYGHGYALLWVNYNCPASQYFNGGKRKSINFDDPQKEYLRPLRDCITSMHVDLYNTYKAVKATGDKNRLSQMFGRATAGCLNEKYRSFETFLSELHKGYKFAFIVEMILSEYTKFVCASNNWPTISYNELAQKDGGVHFYLDDITEYAIKYHGSTISSEGYIVNKDFEKTLESWGLSDRRPPPTIEEALTSDIEFDRLVKYLVDDFKRIDNAQQAKEFEKSLNEIGADAVFNIKLLFKNVNEPSNFEAIDRYDLTFQLRCSLIARLVKNRLFTKKIDVIRSKANDISLHIVTDNFAWSWIEQSDKNTKQKKREALIALNTKIRHPTTFDVGTLTKFAVEHKQNKLLKVILQGQFLTKEEISSLVYLNGTNLLWVCLMHKDFYNLIQLLENGYILNLSNPKSRTMSIWSLAKEWKEEPLFRIFNEYLFTDQLKIIVDDPKGYDITDLVEFIKFSKSMRKNRLGEFAKLIDCNSNAVKHTDFFAQLLIKAVIDNDPTEVEVLLGINAPINHTFTNSKSDKYYGYCALHIAVLQRNAELATALLLAGADPLRPFLKKRKITPLSLALDTKDCGLVGLMLSYIFDAKTAAALIEECFDANNNFNLDRVKRIIVSRIEAETLKHSQAKVFPAQELAMQVYFEKFPESELYSSDIYEESCKLCNVCTMS